VPCLPQKPDAAQRRPRWDSDSERHARVAADGSLSTATATSAPGERNTRAWSRSAASASTVPVLGSRASICHLRRRSPPRSRLLLFSSDSFDFRSISEGCRYAVAHPAAGRRVGASCPLGEAAGPVEPAVRAGRVAGVEPVARPLEHGGAARCSKVKADRLAHIHLVQGRLAISSCRCTWGGGIG
jgi:hypothetical protein